MQGCFFYTIEKNPTFLWSPLDGFSLLMHNSLYLYPKHVLESTCVLTVSVLLQRATTGVEGAAERGVCRGGQVKDSTALRTYIELWAYENMLLGSGQDFSFCNPAQGPYVSDELSWIFGSNNPLHNSVKDRRSFLASARPDLHAYCSAGSTSLPRLEHPSTFSYQIMKLKTRLEDSILGRTRPEND